MLDTAQRGCGTFESNGSSLSSLSWLFISVRLAESTTCNSSAPIPQRSCCTTDYCNDATALFQGTRPILVLSMLLSLTSMSLITMKKWHSATPWTSFSSESLFEIKKVLALHLNGAKWRREMRWTFSQTCHCVLVLSPRYISLQIQQNALILVRVANMTRAHWSRHVRQGVRKKWSSLSTKVVRHRTSRLHSYLLERTLVSVK